MKNKILLCNIPLLFVIIAMASFDTVAAEEYVPKAQKKLLHQAPLPGVEGKEIIVVHLGIAPEFIGSKHIHPGPVYVYVLEGELTVELEDGVKTFKAGDLYNEGINAPMIGRNMSKSDDLEILVFQIGDIGKPMMIKVK